MEVVDDALPIRTLRRQSIALLGPRGAGKTTLATFLHSGEMPQGYQPTVLRSTFMVKGAFLRTLLLLFSLLFGARIKNLPHRLTILDNPGMTPQGVEAVSKLWLQSARSVKNVLYLVDVSKLSNRKYCDMAVNCAREITRWDLGDRRKLLILTHTDLDPAGKSGNFDEISSRKTVDDLRRGLHADDVIMGSQKDYRDTRQLAYHVLQFLALSGWTPCLQRMRAGWPDLACRR